MEVMELLEQHPVDIIILDIKMPKMTGIQAAEQIHEDYPQTKIIILSGYNDFEYARTAMRYGVTDYLLKPVDTLVLKSTLEDCIEKIALSKKQHRQIEKLNHYENVLLLQMCRTVHWIFRGFIRIIRNFYRLPTHFISGPLFLKIQRWRYIV